jgi:AcrR family transcriptional regulator
VPRRGLDRAQVVDAAVAIADADALEAVTLSRVAAALGVKPPSLYNHVDGRDALVRAIALRALGELTDALRRAATGRAGTDALAAVARAQLAYARAHPGRYAATAAEAVEVLTAALAGLELEDDDAVHAIRALRSAVHGFAAIEAAGGFALGVDRDASFDYLVAKLG